MHRWCANSSLFKCGVWASSDFGMAECPGTSPPWILRGDYIYFSLPRVDLWKYKCFYIIVLCDHSMFKRENKSVCKF